MTMEMEMEIDSIKIGEGIEWNHVEVTRLDRNSTSSGTDTVVVVSSHCDQHDPFSLILRVCSFFL